MTDDLRRIWEDQAAFNLLFRNPPASDKEMADQVRDFVLFTESELHELLRTMDWKKHRNMIVRANPAHRLEELADIFKCFMSIVQICGYSREQLFQAYWDKSEVVRNRYREEWTNKIDRPCVVVDIDGVLCDYVSGLLGWVVRHQPDLIAPDVVAQIRKDRRFMNAESCQVAEEAWQQMKHDFRVTGAKRDLPAYHDAASFTRWLQAKGWRVVLLTSRPFDVYPNMLTDTLLWLQRREIAFDFLWWGVDKAERLMASFGKLQTHVAFAVDDDPRYIEQFTRAGLRSYWVQRQEGDPRKTTPLASTYVTVVKGLLEIHEMEQHRFEQKEYADGIR